MFLTGTLKYGTSTGFRNLTDIIIKELSAKDIIRYQLDKSYMRVVSENDESFAVIFDKALDLSISDIIDTIDVCNKFGYKKGTDVLAIKDYDGEKIGGVEVTERSEVSSLSLRQCGLSIFSTEELERELTRRQQPVCIL